jgi:hypothetical protein
VLLETLEIADCEGLKSIIADEKREDEEIDDSGTNKSHGSVFSKLKAIDIEGCHRLESVLPFLSSPALETIRIRKCDGLKYVFGQSQNVELVLLSKLELSELPKFIGIFEECYHPITTSCVKKKGSSSTSNYGSKAQTQLDPPIKCNTFSWWTHICCQTTIPLVDVDVDQPQDYCSVASVSLSSFFYSLLCIMKIIVNSSTLENHLLQLHCRNQIHIVLTYGNVFNVFQYNQRFSAILKGLY